MNYIEAINRSTSDRETRELMKALHEGAMAANLMTWTVNDCPFSTPKFRWIWKLGFVASMEDQIIINRKKMARGLAELGLDRAFQLSEIARDFLNDS